jgi:hypothetical protein
MRDSEYKFCRMETTIFIKLAKDKGITRDSYYLFEPETDGSSAYFICPPEVFQLFKEHLQKQGVVIRKMKQTYDKRALERIVTQIDVDAIPEPVARNILESFFEVVKKAGEK